MEKKKERIIINTILIMTIIGIMSWLAMDEYKDKKVESQQKISDYIVQNISVEENISIAQNQDVKEKVYPKEIIEEEYRGYLVGAKLEIPVIKLETYVLQKYSVQALNVSVTKFWGANANQIGNYCIAGHNFQNKNMFHSLKELKIGDRLFVTDNNVGKVEYEIYDIYQVLPEDVTCLSQETNGKREVTLITCTNDSKKRIIVKAKEWEG